MNKLVYKNIYICYKDEYVYVRRKVFKIDKNENGYILVVELFFLYFCLEFFEFFFINLCNFFR